MKHILAGLALAALSTSAFAASQPPAPGLPMADIAGGRNLTCTTFSKLGGEAATRVLYYLNGYAAGVEDQIAAGTPNANPTADTKVAPSAGPTATPAPVADTTAHPRAAVAANAPAAGSNGVGSMASLTEMTLEQVRALCEAKPDAKVLSLIPGGQPVSANGTLTGTTAAGGTTTGTTGTTTMTGPAGTTTGAAASDGSYNATVNNDAAAAGTSGSTMAPAATPGTATGTSTAGPSPVATPPTGNVTVNPQTGLTTTTTGTGAPASAPATAGTTAAPASP